MSDMTITLTLAYPHDFSWGENVYLHEFDDHDCYVYHTTKYTLSLVIVPRKPTLWQKLISTLKGLFNARPAN
jgi:hypothetical protein